MTIDSLIPQIEALARSGYGWEDVMVRLRIDVCNMHVVRRAVLEVRHDHQRESASQRVGPLPRMRP